MRMRRRSSLLRGVGAVLFILTTAAPRAGHAEGGTWPPVGQLAGGEPWAVAVEGNYAYVAAGGALTVVDVSDPVQPRQAGYCDTPGLARDVAVAGGYACVADSWTGLRVIDVSNPANPTEAGYAEWSGDWAYGVAVSGGCVYVASDTQGAGRLWVIDLWDDPPTVGYCDTPARAWDVAVSGGYAYVANEWAGLRVIDVSDPANPVEVGAWNWPEVPHNAVGVAVSGAYAYVADGEYGLRVINVSDPTNPVAVGSWDTVDYALGVALSGSYAYVADDNAGLRVIDVSNPANPTEVGYWDTPWWVRDEEARGVAVSAGYAYVADCSGGLRVVSVSDPRSPVEVGSLDRPAHAEGLAVAGGYAYVADNRDGLLVIDISDPADATEVGAWDMPPVAQAEGLAVADGYAYVADQWDGLLVIDISDPANPTEVGHCDTPEYACGLAVAGGYAYVATEYNGLRVIDVSNPVNPTEAGYCDIPGQPEGVAVAGGYAYVVGWGGVGQDGRLWVIDVSNPAVPWEVGSCDTPGWTEGVAVAGWHAYVADGPAGLRVIDVSNPVAPVEVGYWDTLGYAYGVAVAGGYAYVADSDGGLRVIDVCDPGAPVEVGYWDTLGYAYGVAVAGGYACVADYGWGLVIFPEYTGGRPKADFTGSPLSGQLLLPVQFTDQSTGSPTSWSWDFGDGGTSLEQNPSHEYADPGFYTVSLTVANAEGWHTETKRSYITAYRFPDVLPKHWAFDEIEACFLAGIVQGYWDGYRPEAEVDRGQMAVYLCRALDLVTAPYEGRFPDDVPDSQWAWPWIEALARAGIVKGFDATHYRPDEIVNRDAMAVYVARSMWGGMDVPTGPAEGTFEDVPDYDPGPAHWAYDEIEYCVAYEVVGGYDPTHYRPDEAVTRDQMAVYVARAFALIP